MTYMGRFKKQLGKCSQKELKTIYSEGNAYVEKYEVTSGK